MLKFLNLARLTMIASLLVMFSGCATSQRTKDNQDFAPFLERVDSAQLEFQQGKPDNYKALWSHGSDVTLAGGFGGVIEQGWENVSKRLDWASSQFSNGRNEIRRLGFSSGENLGYLIQVEHLLFNAPGQTGTAERTYRVTMIFRREDAGWRIVHRHADSQTAKEPPR